MRFDLSEKDDENVVQYFSGNRYMYDGDDNVTALAADDQDGVWVQNARGSVHIKMVTMSMQDRTYTYEKLITDVNERRGMITDSNTFIYDASKDEYIQQSVSTMITMVYGLLCMQLEKFCVIKH